MWDSLIGYLKDRPFSKKVSDAFLVVVVFTWLSIVYVVATNFTLVDRLTHPHPIDVKALVHLDKAVNDELNWLMVGVKGDRAAVARFHDTVSDVQGRHFLFESRTNEVTQPGVAPVGALRQNVLLSMISAWAQQFVDNKCVVTTNLKSGEPYFDFYAQAGVKSDIKCPIFNTQKNLIGFVYVEFIHDGMTDDNFKQIEPTVRAYAEQIGAILSVQD